MVIRTSTEHVSELRKSIRRLPQEQVSEFLEQVIDGNGSRNFGTLRSECLNRLRINKMEYANVLTDQPSVKGFDRTFPYSDEAQLMIEYVKEKGYHEWADMLIDPACGAGHIAIGCPLKDRHAVRVALDASSRALEFTAINRYCNGTDMMIGLNDVGDGLSQWDHSEAQRILFMANMPFAPDPCATNGFLPMASSSDERGSKHTLLALRAFKEFAHGLTDGRAARAIVLVYTIFDEAADRYDLVEQARRLFPGRVSWEFLNDTKVWRINGVKSFPNPMPLELMAERANCRFDVADSRREHARRSYESLAERLKKEGWSHLACGILDIEL